MHVHILALTQVDIKSEVGYHLQKDILTTKARMWCSSPPLKPLELQSAVVNADGRWSKSDRDRK